MQIDFITEPDETGKGRVVVDGRYYGLPLDAVLDYKRLRYQEEDDEIELENQHARDECIGRYGA